MKVAIKVEKEVDLKTLDVDVSGHCWEDATVNGKEDTDGTMIPCRDGDSWCPSIDIDTGQIINWTQGVTADIHYKVRDGGLYHIFDKDGDCVLWIEEDYVPKIMCPGGTGYGDYIIMKVDENGFIQNWKANVDDFLKEE